MELVNGYPCFNCTDVELAKKGVNPAKPQDNPNSPSYDPSAQGAKASGFDQSAIKFGGGLSALNGTQSSGQNGSNPSGSDSGARQNQPGTTLNITA